MWLKVSGMSKKYQIRTSKNNKIISLNIKFVFALLSHLLDKTFWNVHYMQNHTWKIFCYSTSDLKKREMEDQILTKPRKKLLRYPGTQGCTLHEWNYESILHECHRTILTILILSILWKVGLLTCNTNICVVNGILLPLSSRWGNK